MDPPRRRLSPSPSPSPSPASSPAPPPSRPSADGSLDPPVPVGAMGMCRHASPQDGEWGHGCHVAMGANTPYACPRCICAHPHMHMHTLAMRVRAHAHDATQMYNTGMGMCPAGPQWRSGGALEPHDVPDTLPRDTTLTRGDEGVCAGIGTSRVWGWHALRGCCSIRVVLEWCAAGAVCAATSLEWCGVRRGVCPASGLIIRVVCGRRACPAPGCSSLAE